MKLKNTILQKYVLLLFIIYVSISIIISSVHNYDSDNMIIEIRVHKIKVKHILVELSFFHFTVHTNTIYYLPSATRNSICFKDYNYSSST